MPPELARNLRRLMPSFLEVESASSLIRSSTCFCCLVCGFGRYSPLDTFRVGIGERKSSGSTSYARAHLASSSGVIHVWSGSGPLPVDLSSGTAHPPVLEHRHCLLRSRSLRSPFLLSRRVMRRRRDAHTFPRVVEFTARSSCPAG